MEFQSLSNEVMGFKSSYFWI